MIKMKGTIPAKTLAIYQNKPPFGKPATGTSQVSIDIKNFDGNRIPKAKVLQKYLEKMGGFHWGLFGSPLVARLPDGKQMLYDGGHRVKILQLLYPEMKTFPATIIDVEDEKEISRLFHRVNGSAASFVNPETRFINECLGEEEGTEKYINALKKSGAVVYESEDNYVPKETIAPKWKINANPLKEMVDENEEYAIWAIDLYIKGWEQHYVNSGEVGLPITGQIVKALHLLRSLYKSEFDKDDMLEKFEKHFIACVGLMPDKGAHLFNENKHDRMEMRHYGTALGIMSRFCSFGRNQPWAKKTPKIGTIEELYKEYDAKKRAKLSTKEFDFFE